MIEGQIAPDRGQQAEHLFLAYFHRAADAVVGRAVESAGVNEPRLAQHEAGRLGSAKVLAAAKDGGVGAHLGELPQVFDRGKLGGGVHEHGHTVRVGDVDHSVQWEVVGAAHIALEPDDGGGVGVDGRFQLPVECTVGVADLHQLDADLADGVVVAVGGAICGRLPRS